MQRLSDQSLHHLVIINMEDLTEMELEAVTAVFKQFETGVREAAISGKVKDEISEFLNSVITLTIRLILNVPFQVLFAVKGWDYLKRSRLGVKI